MAALKWLVASRIARCEGVGELNDLYDEQITGVKTKGIRNAPIVCSYWIAANVTFSGRFFLWVPHPQY